LPNSRTPSLTVSRILDDAEDALVMTYSMN
jgi:hypothetical protein